MTSEALRMTTPRRSHLPHSVAVSARIALTIRAIAVSHPALTQHATSLRMTFDDYQRLAARTMGPRTREQQLANVGLGLAGEAGEVADTLKKHLFHAHPLDRDALAKELGDCLWYVAGAATALGLSLGEIAAGNVEKLRRRYPDGFSEERSVNRVE